VLQRAMHALLSSTPSVGGLSSMSGQADVSLMIQLGPFHHRVEVDRMVGSMPREMRSAGLSDYGTCRQVADDVSS